MNPALNNLQLYPFQRLNALKAGIPEADLRHQSAATPLPHVPLSIGEPKHAAPDFLVHALCDETLIRQGLGTYPATLGSADLRAAIAQWIEQRFAAPVDPATQVLPVSGTREALFSFGQTVLSGRQGSAVLMPNPFYQIYEGAALLRGAEPVFLPTTQANNYLPDFHAVTASTWRRCEMLYLCSPGNPTGAVLGLDALRDLLDLRDQYGFVIAADECYSEIYTNEASPPPGLLEACRLTGRDDYRGCVVFNSLSKRSNLPGLRSGFIAGDAKLLAPYLQYRTYHGCAMPAHAQAVSALAWADEQHVIHNRTLYREKFAAVTPILASCMDVTEPAAAFFLWPRIPSQTDSNPRYKDDTEFAAQLFANQHVTVLPGSFLSRRDSDGVNPGSNHIRIALVAPIDECVAAAERIKAFVA